MESISIMKSKMTTDTLGNKFWRNDAGEYHREDGPAFEYADGSKYWFLNGKLHREDGPAVEAAGYKAWFLNGKLHREDGPAYETAKGHKEWYINGKLHRESGPAVEYDDGSKYWFLNGNFTGKMVLLLNMMTVAKNGGSMGNI